jgi:hypothetical protein
VGEGFSGSQRIVHPLIYAEDGSNADGPLGRDQIRVAGILS